VRGEDEGIKKKVLSAIKIGVMKIKLSENIFSFHRMNSYALLIFLILTFIVIPLQADEKKLRVMTTFTVIADIVKNVAGDAASVESITKPNAEIHNYQATPGDLRRARGVDLLIYNGLNLEVWFDKFFQNLDDVPSVVISRNIKQISIRQGPYKDKPNPHAWMSPTNVMIYVDNVERALAQHDPANAKVYESNANIYKEKLRRLFENYHQKFSELAEERKWLVTSEGAFSYLAAEFKLKEAYLWPMNSDGQGTPRQIQRVIDLINEFKIPVIFSESTISPKPALQVARETGAAYGGVLYVDSLSDAKGRVPTYIKLISETLDRIYEGLSEGT
jgi:manganese/iron transport system substrate-binding protein